VESRVNPAVELRTSFVVALVFASVVAALFLASFPGASVAVGYLGALAVSERMYRLWRRTRESRVRYLGLSGLVGAWASATAYAALVLPTASRGGL
jgi:hypothetical protein